MDLRQIEYFVKVAELGSFTRASIALGVAQPALSRQVRLLELEFGQALLVRNGRGATATEAGKVLLEQGRGVLHQVSRLRDEMEGVRGGLSGRVSFGLPPSLSKLITVPLVRAVGRDLPGVRLSVVEGLTTSLHEALMSGQLDLALLYGDGPRADLELEHVMDEPLFLLSRYVSGGSARTVSLEALSETNLIIPRRPNAFRMLIEEALARRELPLRIAMEADGVDAILGLVADGLGCAVIGASAVTSGLPGKYQVFPVDARELTARIHLATSSQRPSTMALHGVKQLAKANVVQRLQQHQAERPEPWI